MVLQRSVTELQILFERKFRKQMPVEAHGHGKSLAIMNAFLVAIPKALLTCRKKKHYLAKVNAREFNGVFYVCISPKLSLPADHESSSQVLPNLKVS